ncbi:beta-2 adrenergic receptor-like [Ptychodera flava]|uniref:beta-2 adrenergic receptor-like n=1 Tax=Ptychodera flava TaxID=63121 RepID=UPI00396A922D
MAGPHDSGLAVIVAETILYSTIAFLIISTNLLNIAVLSRNKILSIGGRCFMMSLAVADLGVGLLFGTALVGCVTRKALIDSVFSVCFVLGALNQIVYSASTISLTLIAVDRYLAISRPIYYLNVVTKKKAMVVTLLAWIVLTLYAIVLGLIDGNFYRYNPNTYLCTPFYDRRQVVLVSLITLWIIPFGLIIFTYTQILVFLRNRRRHVGNEVVRHDKRDNYLEDPESTESENS